MLKNIYMMVAITKNTHAIGKDGDMIYHLKEDLKYFKQTTSNNVIVCGRKTYFSFPKRPLPNRKNIVLTRSNDTYEGAISMHSKEEVLEYARNNPDEKIFIVGGDNIYKQFIDDAYKLYITEIEEPINVEADSFFPKFDKKEWKLESISEEIESDNSPNYRFAVYSRK